MSFTVAMSYARAPRARRASSRRVSISFSRMSFLEFASTSRARTAANATLALVSGIRLFLRLVAGLSVFLAKYCTMESSSEIAAEGESLAGLTVCATEPGAEPEEPMASFSQGRLPVDALADASSCAMSKA